MLIADGSIMAKRKRQGAYMISAVAEMLSRLTGVSEAKPSGSPQAKS